MPELFVIDIGVGYHTRLDVSPNVQLKVRYWLDVGGQELPPQVGLPFDEPDLGAWLHYA